MKKLLMVASMLVLAVSLAACNRGGSNEREELFVYNWGFFIDPAVIDMFEEEFNVRVIYDTYDSNESMYQVLRAGTTSFDVVVPSDYMIERMINENMLQPIDLERIPNVSYIMPELMGLPFDPTNQYSVPYFWGTVGILYDSTKVQGPVTSWSILFDEQFAGQIYMYDSVRDTLMVALKKLGYSMNTQNIAELEAARDLLIEQSPLVLAYVTDQVIDSMIQGNAALAMVYSGDAVWIMHENPNMRFAIPEEGTNLWVNSMVIPADAQNPELAHEFINFINRPDIAEMNVRAVFYSSPHTAAMEAVAGEDWTMNDAFNPSMDWLDELNMEMFIDHGDFLSEIDRIWTEVLINARN